MRAGGEVNDWCWICPGGGGQRGPGVTSSVNEEGLIPADLRGLGQAFRWSKSPLGCGMGCSAPWWTERRKTVSIAEPGGAKRCAGEKGN